jgi:hypothetical protein
MASLAILALLIGGIDSYIALYYHSTPLYFTLLYVPTYFTLLYLPYFIYLTLSTLLYLPYFTLLTFLLPTI